MCNKKVNQKVKMYYKNVKEIGQIVDHYKLLKSNIHLCVSILSFDYLPYLPTHK